jgi:hypothetical protein
MITVYVYKSSQSCFWIYIDAIEPTTEEKHGKIYDSFYDNIKSTCTWNVSEERKKYGNERGTTCFA